jgi:uncharacterized cupredoxin-like copper-binding protein/Cu/Ag efflux protein CusF
MKIHHAIVASALVAFAEPALSHGGEKHGKEPDRPVSTDEKAFGREGDLNKVSRTVNVRMSDKMRFTPAQIAVKQGETVRFYVKNAGRVMHEMVLGTMEELKEHSAMMQKHPGMEHDEPYMAHVAPGKTETMVWQFTKAGEFYYGCLVPGHFEAGMIGKVKVAAKSARASRHAESATSRSSADNASRAPESPTQVAEGEIRKVDKDAKKITIKHGPLDKLEMPAMTMVFHVLDVALLETVKAGDRVKFEAEKIGGAFVVTKIGPVQ